MAALNIHWSRWISAIFRSNKSTFSRDTCFLTLTACFKIILFKPIQAEPLWPRLPQAHQCTHSYFKYPQFPILVLKNIALCGCLVPKLTECNGVCVRGKWLPSSVTSAKWSTEMIGGSSTYVIIFLRKGSKTEVYIHNLEIMFTR